MLGSNPSAGSVASTDSGGMLRHPLLLSAPEPSNRERHQSDKSWGCGGKAPVGYADTKLPFGVWALSHNASPFEASWTATETKPSGSRTPLCSICPGS